MLQFRSVSGLLMAIVSMSSKHQICTNVEYLELEMPQLEPRKCSLMFCSDYRIEIGLLSSGFHGLRSTARKLMLNRNSQFTIYLDNRLAGFSEAPVPLIWPLTGLFLRINFHSYAYPVGVIQSS